jgi:hypothetical protein
VRRRLLFSGNPAARQLAPPKISHQLCTSTDEFNTLLYTVSHDMQEPDRPVNGGRATSRSPRPHILKSNIMPFLCATRLTRQVRATSPPIPEDLEIVTKRQILRQDIVQPEEPEPEVQFLFECRRPAANRSHNEDQINKPTPQSCCSVCSAP